MCGYNNNRIFQEFEGKLVCIGPYGTECQSDGGPSDKTIKFRMKWIYILFGFYFFYLFDYSIEFMRIEIPEYIYYYVQYNSGDICQCAKQFYLD